MYNARIKKSFSYSVNDQTYRVNKVPFSHFIFILLSRLAPAVSTQMLQLRYTAEELALFVYKTVTVLMTQRLHSGGVVMCLITEACPVHKPNLNSTSCFAHNCCYRHQVLRPRENVYHEGLKPAVLRACLS